MNPITYLKEKGILKLCIIYSIIFALLTTIFTFAINSLFFQYQEKHYGLYTACYTNNFSKEYHNISCDILKDTPMDKILCEDTLYKLIYFKLLILYFAISEYFKNSTKIKIVLIITFSIYALIVLFLDAIVEGQRHIIVPVVYISYFLITYLFAFYFAISTIENNNYIGFMFFVLLILYKTYMLFAVLKYINNYVNQSKEELK